MSVGYTTVGWNPQKKRYDTWLAVGVVGALAVALGVGALLQPNATAETLVIRAFGATAFLLLHLILAIGPLCRLDARYLPLLYNRRHMGVTMALLASVHGGLSLVQFHALGDVHPLVSLLTSGDPTSLARFPFQPLGFVALVILVLMAATSHDFWLANLGPRLWKALHMSVYLAWALVLAHVLLGVGQVEPHPLVPLLLGGGALLVCGLHLVAGWKERRADREPDAAARAEADGFVRVARWADIPENRAQVVTLGDERVAVFRYGDCVSVVSNVCRHQNGPLGEGRILDGCITCPWHGYQYEPHNGTSPPPFTERVPTYRVRVAGDDVFVHPEGLAPGTPVEPARIGSPSSTPAPAQPLTEFYVGYLPDMPPGHARRMRRLVPLLVVGGLLCSFFILVGHRRLAPATFEFGVATTVRGTLLSEPLPLLCVPRPQAVDGSQAGVGSGGSPAAFSTYLLSAPGKQGAQGLVEPFHGQEVELEGSLVYRGGTTMLELVPDSIRPQTAGEAQETPGPPPAPGKQSLGRVRLRGEIVDAKCFLGVMNPGERKPHRACAVRCISGGIPPMLRAKGEDGVFLDVVLVGADGAGIGMQLLDLVAEPVEVEGDLFRMGELNAMAIERKDVRRLP